MDYTEFASRFYDVTLSGRGVILRASEEQAKRAAKPSLLQVCCQSHRTREVAGIEPLSQALVSRVDFGETKDANPLTALSELVYGKVSDLRPLSFQFSPYRDLGQR